MTKKTTKKMGKPIHKQDPKKLGYEPSRKGNVSSYTRSKLNDDTASYRGKFQHTAKPLGGRKMNIATIGHLVSKNGFNTTIKKVICFILFIKLRPTCLNIFPSSLKVVSVFFWIIPNSTPDNTKVNEDNSETNKNCARF
jgi:hypothetical protein